jgi:hypothetical protein
MTVAGSQTLVAAPAGAQATKPTPVAVGPLASAAPAKAPPGPVPVGNLADVPAHPSAGGDQRRPAAPGTTAGYDAARSSFIDAETTPTKKVAANPDGSKTLFQTAQPTRFKDPSGTWRDIDISLVAGADGSLAARSSPVGARLGAGAAGDLATLDTGAGPVVLRHPDAVAAKPTIRTTGPRSEALYARGLSGGRDVVMSLTGTGIKENVVLADAKAPATYVDELSLPPGVTAHPTAAGIDLADASGEVVASVAGGLAHDASFPRAGPASATPVTLMLVAPSRSAVPTASVVAVEVGIDAAWLGGPRQFPVTIDPSVFNSHATAAEGGRDTFVADQGWTNTDFSTWSTLYTGTNDANVTHFRTQLSFNTAALPTGDVQVSAGTVWLYNAVAPSCTPRTVQIAGLASPLPATPTWANQPSVGAVQPNAPSFAHGASGCLGDFVAFDITPLAQTWASGAPNNGVALAAADETISDNFRTFYSSEEGIPSANPTLIINYNRRPTMPTAASPADGAVLTTTTPVLTLNPATDPDNDTVSYFIRVTDSPDAETGAKVAESPGFVAGTQGGLSFTVPPGALLDGVTYWWHGYAADASSYALTTWAFSFRIDLALGRDGMAPTDDTGPASVNLANGNLVVSHASPALDTVGGPVGATLAYNSSDQAVGRPASPSGATYGPYGLTGEYFNNDDGAQPPNFANKAPVMVRRDTSVNFDWGTAGGPPGLGSDNFLVRWSGSFIPPRHRRLQVRRRRQRRGAHLHQQRPRPRPLV